MHGPTLEQLDAEYQLLLARRRAERCAPSSPSWDAAMETIRDWEQRVVRLDQHATEHRWLGFATPPAVESSR